MGGTVMDIYVGSVTKKINSTYRPTLTNKQECKLKDNCSKQNPIVSISGSIVDLMSNYNYAYIPDFGCYYYISDIVAVNNSIAELHLTIDVLATHKNAILATTAYVEYANIDWSGSQSGLYNNLIPDKRLTMTYDEITSIQFTDSVWTVGDGLGTYVINLAGSDGAALVGMTEHYAMSVSSIQALASRLYTQDVFEQINDYFNSPFDSIISAHWIPWKIYGSESAVMLGNYTPSNAATGIRLRGIESLPSSSFTITIPWINGDWRDFTPYSRLELYLPLYGTVDLDLNILEGLSNITVKYNLDPISGEICYAVEAGSWKALYRVDAKVPIATGQTKGEPVQAITEIFGGLTALGVGAVTGGIGEAAALAGGMAIADGIKTAYQQTSTSKGGNGGFARGMQANQNAELRSIRLNMHSHAFSQNPTDIVATNGLPIFKNIALSNFNGFVKCSGAYINMGGSESDKEQVNSYVNNGFFIE